MGTDGQDETATVKFRKQTGGAADSFRSSPSRKGAASSSGMPRGLASAAAPRALGTRFSLGENGDIAGARLIRSVKLMSLAVGNEDVDGAVRRVVKMVRTRAKQELERWGSRGLARERSIGLGMSDL